jgi:hypothetical protein
VDPPNPDVPATGLSSAGTRTAETTSAIANGKTKKKVRNMIFRTHTDSPSKSV